MICHFHFQKGTEKGAHDTSTSSKSEFDSALARRKVTNLWRRLGHFFLRIRTRSESSERRERPRPRTAVAATFTAVALIGSRVISTAKCRFKAVRSLSFLLSYLAPFTPFGGHLRRPRPTDRPRLSDCRIRREGGRGANCATRGPENRRRGEGTFFRCQKLTFAVVIDPCVDPGHGRGRSCSSGASEMQIALLIPAGQVAPPTSK